MAPASLEGKNLGKYRVLEPLGRGGMAQVYRAYHPQLDRYLAIKVLRSDLVEEAEFLARFQREARAVAALRHPNIVHIYDFDVQDDIYYMVMELLEGDTLKARMNGYRARGQMMPPAEVVRILTDALNGLGFAHSEGVIHRDIKPANIMLDRRGQAIITDFGIAQIVGGTQYTVSGALMGTLSYMAPEQGFENRCDARSDLYSLGIVFYEMVTGRPPFDADTPLAILMKHLNDPLPLPRQFNPNMPEAFERVLLKVLAKNPDDRYQTAAEMAQALQNAAAEAHVDVAEAFSKTAQSTPGSAEGAAVFSGEARQHIPDVRFASDDTDAGLSQTLAPEGASPVREILKDSVKSPGSAALAFAFSLVIVNLAAVSLGTLTQRWGIFRFGWPFELFLVSLGLSLLMASLSSIWLFIPAGILFGNGVLLAFYALTGLWGAWAFLWPVEPILVFAVLWLTIVSGRRKDTRKWARPVGLAMAVASALLMLSTMGIGFVAGLFR